MGFFAVSAIVGCTAETSSDATSNEPVTGSGAHPPGEVGAKGDPPGAVETTATGLPCDVDKVLKSRCQTCHASDTRYGASAPLVTYEDLQKTTRTSTSRTRQTSRSRRRSLPVT